MKPLIISFALCAALVPTAASAVTVSFEDAYCVLVMDTIKSTREVIDGIPTDLEGEISELLLSLREQKLKSYERHLDRYARLFAGPQLIA